MVGINYPTDRKNFIGTMRAFKNFYHRHPEARLYLHTDVMASIAPGINLVWLMNNLGFSSENKDPIKFVSQKEYHKWSISEEYMVRSYNSFDILCSPNKGEGFGLPLVEAQSCGTPIIVTDTTSGAELLKGGWLIPVEDKDMEYSSHLTWYASVKQDKIEEHMEQAYQEWKSGKIKERGEQAREGMLQYDWDMVYKEHWRDIFKFLEREKDGYISTIPDFPNYTTLYENFGEIFQSIDCRLAYEGSPKSCEVAELPKLLGESENDKMSMLVRSYPVFPDSEGELYVHTNCKAHTMLPPRFIKQCQDKYTELLSYPKVRAQIKKWWDEDKIPKPYMPVKDVKPVFDSNYASLLQKVYITAYKLDEENYNFLSDCKTVLDVGCGNGERVKDLNNHGKLAKGIEINPYWVNNVDVFEGSAERIPFEDNSIDAIICIDVLEHVNNPRQCLKEIFRVIRKKAILVITVVGCLDFDEDPTHIVKWTLEQWIREINEYASVIRQSPAQLGVLLVEKKNAL
jgi:ubiquinone/menaquinone biosynthesis C-methylase UbiE